MIDRFGFLVIMLYLARKIKVSGRRRSKAF